MELTHSQAREMIQFHADAALTADYLRMLKTHLALCEACRRYADSIQTMEIRLRRVMTKRWDLRPAPLALDTIKSKSFSKSFQFTQLTTRLTMIATVALLIVFAALGITNGTKEDEINQAPLVVPLIPTPSMQITHTLTQSCGQIRYQVQAGDTLDSVAFRFSISREDLLVANHMGTDTIITGTELIIPLCNSAATGTVHPPAFTTTITPLTEVISRTPDG